MRDRLNRIYNYATCELLTKHVNMLTVNTQIVTFAFKIFLQTYNIPPF